MKKLFIIALLFNSLSSFCQFSEKLDVLYGFKKFKFRQSPTQIANIQKLSSDYMPQKNVTRYKYTGTDIQNFNGVQIDEIQLEFYKNKLYQVKVVFGNIKKEYTSEEYTVVQNALINNFGSPYISNEPNSVVKILNSSFWTGKKVLLNHLRLDLGDSINSNNNRIAGYMLFTESTLKELQQSDELQ